jgi:hypothetical protein
VRKSYDDAVAFAFSAAFSVSPENTRNKAAVIFNNKETDDEDAGPLPSHLVEDNVVEWFSPPPPNITAPSLALTSGNAVPDKPLSQPSSSLSDLFELGMSLSFYDGHGNAEVVVYKGVMPNGLTHTVRQKDGSCLNVHDAHLCLKLQADLSNLPKMPLDYCKKGWHRYLQR